MKKKSAYYRLMRLMKGELILRYDSLNFSRQGVSAHSRMHLLLGRLEYALRVGKPLSYPQGIQLEPTIACQLDCPYCPRIKATEGMELGHMKWEDYERLLKEVGPYVNTIAFWQWGEPLLHPRMADMIRLADSYGIISMMSTNAQIDPDDIDLEALVDSGLDMLIVSMDGITQETFEKFRAGGQIQRLRRFTEAVIDTKRRLKNERLKINIRVVATSENEQEIEAVRSYAREIGADLFSVKSVSLYYEDDPDDPHLPQDRNLRSFQYQGREEAEKYRQMPNMCRKPWKYPTLRYDGTLLFCECDHMKEAVLGNVFDAGSFRKVWRGTAAADYRKRFKRNGEIDLDFCRRCRYKIGDAIRVVEDLKIR